MQTSSKAKDQKMYSYEITEILIPFFFIHDWVIEQHFYLCHQNSDKLGSTRFTVVGFKLSGPFKFFFVIINVRVTFFDAKGPIE